MRDNRVTTVQPSAAAVLAPTTMWCDETGLHIRQEQNNESAAVIFIPPGHTGRFFDGLLSILVGPIRTDKTVL